MMMFLSVFHLTWWGGLMKWWALQPVACAIPHGSADRAAQKWSAIRLKSILLCGSLRDKMTIESGNQGNRSMSTKVEMFCLGLITMRQPFLTRKWQHKFQYQQSCTKVNHFSRFMIRGFTCSLIPDMRYSSRDFYRVFNWELEILEADISLYSLNFLVLMETSFLSLSVWDFHNESRIRVKNNNATSWALLCWEPSKMSSYYIARI